MGTTFYNYHVRTEDTDAVRKAIEDIQGIAWIAAEPINGWVSVYPYSLMLNELAQVLNLPLIELNIYDNDIATYQLYEGGVLVDEYNSCPDYWPEYDENGDELPKTPEELAFYAPSPEKLLPYCLPQFTLEDVEAAFRISRLDALKRAEQFARENYPDHQSFPKLPNHPAFDLPDAFSVLMELFRLLGLETRCLYSGHGLVDEEDFPLTLVGEERLKLSDLNKLLEQSVPDVRAIPTSGKACSENPEKKLALIKKWLGLGANPDGFGDGVFTPLMRAASGGSVEAVQMLLEAGASANFAFMYIEIGVPNPRSAGVELPPLVLNSMIPNVAEIMALLKSSGAEEQKRFF